jgi:hypothetical protein
LKRSLGGGEKYQASYVMITNGRRKIEQKAEDQKKMRNA